MSNNYHYGPDLEYDEKSEILNLLNKVAAAILEHLVNLGLADRIAYQRMDFFCTSEQHAAAQHRENNKG
jgi:hypothetical protein